MTDSPVAAANARTMWKREIPATPAISSRVSWSARWLSMNQSAFWAGFMDHGLHSKPAHYDRLPRAAFDSPCSRFAVSPNWNRTQERDQITKSCAALCRASMSFLMAQQSGRGWPGHLARRRALRFCPAMTEKLAPFYFGASLAAGASFAGGAAAFF